MRGKVEADLASLHDGRRLTRVPPGDGPDAGEQFGHLVWLQDEVVGAEIERTDPGVEPVPRRDDDEGRRVSGDARLAEQVGTVPVRQSEIEENDRVIPDGQRLAGRPPRRAPSPQRDRRRRGP